ncbi:ArnT family glycosyltransferase [Sphingomonas sp.]|uniref:ArnT family glycosyltransferase n=1 Tax=Sphingomonas sp. TaxID=28214 RepID=UPI003CC56AD8
MLINARPSPTRLLLIGILLAGLLLRLRGLGFGLPALYDPDEPLFVLTGLKLLRDGTLNPGWFGHPGTQTIYVLAAIGAGLFGWGRLTGAFPNAEAFAQSIYHDPTALFLSGRVFMVVCALVVILLTWLVARRLFDARTGLLAAALLAIDPIHIRWSQVIRTDVHATVFVLLTLLAAVAVARRGALRDYAWAGVALGFACATKWPSAAAAIGLIGAAALRWHDDPGERRRIIAGLTLFGVAAVAGLFVASPYLFLDWRTVLVNLHGEGRATHLSATGNGLFPNMAWYLMGPLAQGLSWAGLVLAAAGLWLGARRSRMFAAVVVPVTTAFFVIISGQALIWERWVVPLLPLLSIAAAVSMLTVIDWAASRWGRRGAWVAALSTGLAVALPLAITGNAQAAERRTDTRRLASDWARAHIAPGSSVAIEYPAFDVLGQPWRFLYPVGNAGCVDARAALQGKVRYSTVLHKQGERTVIDLANIPPERIASCRGDWLMIVNWDRYHDEAPRYPAELAIYRRMTAGGVEAATFRPAPGEIGGPVVRIVRLAKASPRR